MLEKLVNLISPESKKIKGHCRICNRPLFNLDTSWGMRGICVYCGEAYEEGKKSGVEKISENDYGYIWYTEEEISKVLTIEKMKEGFTSLYDQWLDAYRIYKPKRKKGKSIFDF